MIMYNNQFINRIQNSKKEGKINKGYLIKYNFMVEIFKINIYKLIFGYIYNNKNIQKLFLASLNEDYNDIYEKVLKEFDANNINKSTNNNDEMKNYSHIFDANIKLLKLNSNNRAYVTNNFIIMNEEIYNLFASNESYCLRKDMLEYFKKEKNIY